MEQLGDGTFSKTGNIHEFDDVKNNLMLHDRYYTLADFDSYIEAQDKVNATYKVQKKVFYLLFSDLFQGKKYSKIFFFNKSLELGTMGQNGRPQCCLVRKIQF